MTDADRIGALEARIAALEGKPPPSDLSRDLAKRLDEGAVQLERELTEIFSRARFIPDDIVQSVDDHVIAEDGSLIVYCTTTEGHLLIAAFRAGEPPYLNVQK